MRIRFYFVFAAFLLSCNTPREYVMPYVNLEYDGRRLFPVSENDADFTLRIWFNASSTVDRVFTITHTADSRYSGKLLEIRRRANWHQPTATVFKENDITPRCGFEAFVAKVDSLNLLYIKDQDEDKFAFAFDEPISLFVVEIKSHGRFNHFKFHTHIMRKKDMVEARYQKIKDLVFKELPFEFHFTKN